MEAAMTRFFNDLLDFLFSLSEAGAPAGENGQYSTSRCKCGCLAAALCLLKLTVGQVIGLALLSGGLSRF